MGFEAPEITNSAGSDIFPDGTPGLVWVVQWASNPAPPGRPATANAELQNVTALSVSPYEGFQYAELDSDWDGPGGGLNGEAANMIMSQAIDTTAGKH
jgi:hypothetical protein